MLVKFLIAYVDKILIYVHIIHVRKVLSRLLQDQLYVKGEKYEFRATKVTFLGYIIGPE